MTQEWHTAPPPEGVLLETKIDDAHGCRNEAKLTFRNRMWWLGDNGNPYHM